MRATPLTAAAALAPLALPFLLIAALGALAGCAELGSSDEVALRRSKPAKRPIEGTPSATPTRRSPWAYVLPVDHAIRRDAAGAGPFAAPRAHGKHNGIDLLAPVGTPALSACNGSAEAGKSTSFGRWVHVVCAIPPDLADGKLFASFFYAHLDTLEIDEGDWVPVMRGQKLGTVGKTGNARGDTVAPHLHLEMAVHPDEKSARADTHAGTDQSSSAAANQFFRSLERSCLEPRSFGSKQSYRRARRADPLVVLRCLDVKKPSFEMPAPPLDASVLRWDEQYGTFLAI